MRRQFLTMLVGIIFAFGANGMAQTPVLVLQSTMESDGAVKTIDLYSEEPSLGSGGMQRIVEGRVSTGNPRVKYLASSLPEKGKIKWDYYGIDIPFTLHRLDGERYYEVVLFRVTLKDMRSIAYDIFPSDSIKSTTKVKKNVSFTADMKFNLKAMEANTGANIADSSEYIVLTPVLTPFGKGENQFYWEHKGFNGQPVTPGVKQAAVVLRVPHGLRQINANLEYRADIVETLFGVMTVRKSKADAFPVTLKLAREG
jgi:hypothetical protein